MGLFCYLKRYIFLCVSKKETSSFKRIFFSRDEEYHGFLQRFKAAGTSLKSKTFTPAALKLMSCPKKL